VIRLAPSCPPNSPPSAGPRLRTLLERGQVSGDLCANANLDLLVDVFYGVLWFACWSVTRRWTHVRPATWPRT
jgi:hypothetical protein